MRRLLLTSLLVLQACAWSQAEFRKWTQKDAGPDKQLEKVGANADEVEKFTVEDSPDVKVDPPVTAPEAPVPPAVERAKPKAIIKPAPIEVKNSTKSVRPTAVKGKLPTAEKSAAAEKAPAPFAYPEAVPPEIRAMDEEGARAWGAFRPSFTLNESHFLDVDYLGVTVGKVVLGYKGIKMMNGKEVYHFQARFKTAPFYSAIYELDDRIDTYVDKQSFTGRRYNLVQRDSKQNIDEVQLYDQDQLKTTAYQKQVRPDKTKNRHWEGPMPRYNIDSLSAIFLIRGLPLRVGESWAINIVNKAKVLALNLKVELREKIQIKGKDRQTLRVHAYTKYSGETLKSGDMTFWLSDDGSKELLRAKADIKIGAVYIESSDGD